MGINLEEKQMQDLLMIFLSIFVFAFGIFCLIFGVFTAYFGTGKSRSIGGGLIVLGIVGLLIVVWFTGVLPVASPISWDFDVLIESIIAVIAALVGGLVALGIFLGAIMKS